MDHFINEKIREAIEKGKLVFFIGSGMSLPLGIPTWNGLVMEIFKQLNKLTNNASYEAFRVALESNGKMTALDALKFIETMDKGDAFEVLAKVCTLNEDDPDLLGKLKNHRKLWEITDKIITTNYDNALEIAAPRKPKTVVNDQFNLARFDQFEETVFKLHGTVDSPTTCVLFEEMYEKIYSEDETAQVASLRRLIAEKTIIFIGFSMNDPYVTQLFESFNKSYTGLQPNHHFVVTTAKQDFSKFGVRTILVENYREDFERWLESLVTIKNFCLEAATADLQEQAVVEAETVVKDRFTVETRIPRIALLVADPINTVIPHQLNQDLKEVQKYFGARSVTLETLPLTAENLVNVSEYDYVFLFTVTAEDGLVIEDNFMALDLLDFETIQMMLTDVKGLFLFVDEFLTLSEEDTWLPIFQKKHGKGMVPAILHTVFRNTHRLKAVNQLRCNNSELFVPVKLENGTASFPTNHTKLPQQIDKKIMDNFVGRQEELLLLSEKILNIGDSFVTIKASGGSGKTTLVKRLAIEFSKRSLFSEGIYFLDFRNNVELPEFERMVLSCFTQEEKITLEEYAEDKCGKFQKLLILDNFETLLGQFEAERYKYLVSLIANFSYVIVTTRELLDIEGESFLELGILTMEQALDLFLKYHQKKVSESDQKILVEEILDPLLGRNPLAIQIIAKVPKDKSMRVLQKALVDDFFGATTFDTTDLQDEYDKNGVTQTNLLYKSINFSFQRLKPTEQLTFERLSLFPGGINMELFKQVYKGANLAGRFYSISDTEIRALMNKSLLESDNGHISLQSMIGAFAEFQFKKRPEQEKSEDYKRAFWTNHYFLKHLFENKAEKIPVSWENNFFKTLELLPFHDAPGKEKLLFLLNISSVSEYYEQQCRIVEYSKELKEHLVQFEYGDIVVNTIMLYTSFYSSDIVESQRDFLLNNIPFEKIKDFVRTDRIQSAIISQTLSIYEYFGESFQVLKYMVDEKWFSQNKFISATFRLGLYSALADLGNNKEYMQFDANSNEGIFDLQKIDKYLSELDDSFLVDQMQVSYIKAKQGLLAEDAVKSLVVTNQYSRGLKYLMLAFLEKKPSKAIPLYLKAIEKLEHIKYYYCESIYFFSKYLKEVGSDEFASWFDKGKQIADKFHFRYLIHCFICLQRGQYTPYIEADYRLPEELDLSNQIAYYKKENGV